MSIRIKQGYPVLWLSVLSMDTHREIADAGMPWQCLVLMALDFDRQSPG